MILDDVRAKEPVINEYFCRGRHNNCNMIYLNQNLFSLDRQSVRENCNLFFLNKEVKSLHRYIKISLIMLNLVIMISLLYGIRYGKSLIIILSLI